MLLIACPRCDSELDVPADWLGESVQCSSCQTEFIARDKARSRPIARPRYDEEGDRPRRPRKQGGWTVRHTLGGLLALFVMAGTGAGLKLASESRKPTAFAASDWKDHVLTGGNASVQCPVKMTPEPVPGLDEGITGQKCVWLAPGGRDIVFAFGYVEGPSDCPMTLDEALEWERDGLSKMKLRIVSERDLVIQGCPAKEVELAKGSAQGIYRIVCVEGPEKKQFIVMMAGGRHLSVTDRTRFLESFRLRWKK